MKTVELTGKSHKGKTKIALLGSIWAVIEEKPSKLFVCPVVEFSETPSATPRNARWIEKQNDCDFLIIEK